VHPESAFFFIDSNQAVTVKDAGTREYIEEVASAYVHETIDLPRLDTQFRVLGGDAYLHRIRMILGYPGESEDLVPIRHYDFRVFDSPCKMREELRRLNGIYGKTRMVSGYVCDWKSEDGSNQYDITLEGGKFLARWNLKKKSDYEYSWLFDDSSFEEVGCIHTCQGLDMEYCGVIIGNDMRYENGEIIFDQTKIADTDKSSGIKKCNPELAEKLIRNTYNVLLSRGMRGTFVYC